MADPRTPDERVVRGSSWHPLDRHHKATTSSGLGTDNPDNSMGFRTFRNSRQEKGTPHGTD